MTPKFASTLWDKSQNRCTYFAGKRSQTCRMDTLFEKAVHVRTDNKLLE
uniref:Uncharacterized protein n=1 Tax=Anguilla anguilla TaxID=7936 RepID=A0A0E9PRV9_ANGAN